MSQEVVTRNPAACNDHNQYLYQRKKEMIDGRTEHCS